MYRCLLPEFPLAGALRRILTGVSPVAELSLDSNLLSISIPQDQGKYMVHQAEPLYLARLNTTGRSPGIPEGAVKDRLTYCHSSLRHGTHTVGLGTVFQGLLL